MASYSSGPRRPPPPAKPPIRSLSSLTVDVDLSDPDPPADDWVDSTFDLRSGLTVIEHPIDTLPGELQDAFNRPKR